MGAHQIMTRPVFTILPDATIFEAANLIEEWHISGLPVVDAAGKLVSVSSRKAISCAAAKSAPNASAAA